MIWDLGDCCQHVGIVEWFLGSWGLWSTCWDCGMICWDLGDCGQHVGIVEWFLGSWELRGVNGHHVWNQIWDGLC